MNKTKIPEPVLQSFEYFTERFGGRVVYAGEAPDGGGSVYNYEAPSDLDIGFPEVRLWTPDNVVVAFDGYDALDLLQSVSKNS